MSLQRGLAERNAEVPEDQRIQVRIGINLGEVIVEGDDRYGEGVNIAARLEQLAEPGGIWVSGKVAKEVEKKLDFGFEPMGAQRSRTSPSRSRPSGSSSTGCRAKRGSRRREPSLPWAAAVRARYGGGSASGSTSPVGAIVRRPRPPFPPSPCCPSIT